MQANTIIVDPDGRLEIPAVALCDAKAVPGQSFEVEVTPGGIWLRPADRDPDQWWYWTPEFQAGEREAEAERRAGIVGQRHDSDEAFLASLAARIRQD